MTGYSSEEAMGRNCRFLQGKNTDPLAVEALHEAILEERTCTVELLNYRRNGTSFWNSLTISPVRTPDGTLTHFVGRADGCDAAKSSWRNSCVKSQKMEAIGQLAGRHCT